MATNFPDISAINPDTGALWSAGDTFEDPSSGLTYTWMPPTWKASGVGESTTPDDGTFVKVAGDDMTGNLTLGTDKITLDATTGGAEFAGTINGTQMFLAAPDLGSNLIITNTEPGTDKVVNMTLRSGNGNNKGGISAGVWDNNLQNGYLAFQTSLATNLNTRAIITPGGDFRINADGLTPESDAAIDLKSDGSAEFAGNVEVGNFDNTTGTKAFASGSLQVRRNDSNTAIVVYKDGTATGNQTAVINADGGATFAGGNYAINASGGVNQFARINMKVGPDPTTSAFSVANITGSGIKSRWYGDGSLSIGGTIGGNGVATDNANITLNAGDGSASFAGGSANIYNNGTIRVGSNPGSDSSFGADLNTNGQVRIRTSETEALRIFPNTGENDSINLNSDGSADFAGRISAFGDVLEDNGSAMGDGGVQYRNDAGNSNAGFKIYSGGYTTNDQVARIGADGSATFAQSLSANGGKVRTFTGTAGLYLDVRQVDYVGVNVVTNGNGKQNACLKLQNGTSGSSYLIAGYGASNAEVYSVTNNGTVGTRNVLFNLEPDNDTYYVTTTGVDEDGNTVETRVYNGPTLDVKERLQTKTAALEAIKAAAEDANITTLADFKAAIAAALANI